MPISCLFIRIKGSLWSSGSNGQRDPRFSHITGVPRPWLMARICTGTRTAGREGGLRQRQEVRLTAFFVSGNLRLRGRKA